MPMDPVKNLLNKTGKLLHNLPVVSDYFWCDREQDTTGCSNSAESITGPVEKSFHLEGTVLRRRNLLEDATFEGFLKDAEAHHVAHSFFHSLTGRSFHRYGKNV